MDGIGIGMKSTHPNYKWEHLCCRGVSTFVSCPVHPPAPIPGRLYYGPAIHDVSRRSGCIRIDASDNVHVARVQVTISDEQGNVLEQGEAGQVYGWWEFETRTAGTVLVEVWDLAGNLARQEA